MVKGSRRQSMSKCPILFPPEGKWAHLNEADHILTLFEGKERVVRMAYYYKNNWRSSGVGGIRAILRRCGIRVIGVEGESPDPDTGPDDGADTTLPWGCLTGDHHGGADLVLDNGTRICGLYDAIGEDWLGVNDPVKLRFIRKWMGLAKPPPPPPPMSVAVKRPQRKRVEHPPAEAYGCWIL